MTMFYRANYSDGTHFTFSEDSEGKDDYKKIDRSKLVSFELYNDTKPMHTLHLEPGQRLIVRRRVLKQFGTKGGVAFENLIILYLVGYQETIRGENRQNILVFYPDGHTESISQWKEEPLSCPSLQPQEESCLL